MHFTALNRARRAHKNAKKNEVLSTTVVIGVALLEKSLIDATTVLRRINARHDISIYL